MIISHIIGGMGNQFFQYAAGRALSIRHSTPLKLDIHDFAEYELRRFELGNFPTQFSLATEEDTRLLKPATNLAKALQYLRSKKNRTYHRERHFHYDPGFKKIGAETYLKGNFQSQKYFQDIRPVLLQELAVPENKIGKVSDLGKQIKNENSVSVHIRRTDYTKPVFLEYHGLCTAAYYREAIDHLRKADPDCRFYFFSDDIDWAQNEIPVENATYVSGNIANTHYEDFYLMQCCRHNIIANSSFSWWAAWLNSFPGKTVIAPRKWFGPSGPADTQDIIPETWITF